MPKFICFYFSTPLGVLKHLLQKITSFKKELFGLKLFLVNLNKFFILKEYPIIYITKNNYKIQNLKY